MPGKTILTLLLQQTGFQTKLENEVERIRATVL